MSDELSVQVAALQLKVAKLERATLASLGAVLQLQSITSQMRFKLNLGLDDELHKEFVALSQRMDKAIERLSESMDANP